LHLELNIFIGKKETNLKIIRLILETLLQKFAASKFPQFTAFNNKLQNSSVNKT